MFIVLRVILLALLVLPPKDYSGGPFKDWWPLSDAKKQIVETIAAEAVASGKCAPDAHLDWPPLAVEIKLCPNWGDYMHVGGRTDFRELGCWRQYHVTMSKADSVVCTLVFASNRDSTCAVMDSSETDFSLDRIEVGASRLARRARGLYRSMHCIPKEPLVLLRAWPDKNVYYKYLDCAGELRTLVDEP
jgi:hypothetical protein